MKNLLSSCELNNISGDQRLNFFKKLYWLLICIINYFISFTVKKDTRIKLVQFKGNNQKYLKKNESPARVLSDIFWASFPWKKNKKILGRKYEILEIGCGDGKYGIMLKKILKQNFKGYLGIDIRKRDNWHRTNKDLKFVVSDCYSIKKYLYKKNLIITQSALEHFKYDIKFFNVLKNNLSKTDKIIQIHLIPSYGCLFTYFWHGYRHYNINSISKITKIFKKNCHFKLFALGSSELNLFHFLNITIKKNQDSKTRNKENKYFRKMKKLILKSFNSEKIAPSFYALVIFHNFKKKYKI